jgi:arabinofuranosyltransferase
MRFLPIGYRASLASDRNLVRARKLSQYYDRLRFVIGGDLFDPRRWGRTLELMTGTYDHLLDEMQIKRCSLARLGRPRLPGSRWDAPGNVIIGSGGLDVDLGRRRHSGLLEISLSKSCRYWVWFLRRGTLDLENVGERTLGPRPGEGMALYRIKVPRSTQEAGYERIRIMPGPGNGRFSLGHVTVFRTPPPPPL